jgi:hypothetical protein
VLDFPNSPTVGQVFPCPATPGVAQWQWSGTYWTPVASATAPGPLGFNILFFTASGTYTPSKGAQYAIIEGVGGGGGGGGVAGVGTTNASNGGGGGGGAAYAKRTLSIAQIGATATVTIGANGNGGAAGANSGQAGGTTSVTGSLYGTIISCPGGNGGVGVSGVAAFGQGGNASSVGIGDIGIQGGYGNGAIYTAGTSQAFYGATNNGGYSAWGMGGRTTVPGAGATANGFTGLGYGAGGSGAIFQAVAANAPGGPGSPGAVMITEFGNFSAVGFQPPVRGEIAGLRLSVQASPQTPTFTVQPGAATDSTASYSMTLPSVWTKTASAWAAGSGVGSLDTGTIATATWYHVFLIMNPLSGAVDLLTSRSPNNPTLPAGFTLFRRIGSMFYSGTGPGWLYFAQSGDVFRWGTGRWDVQNGSPVSGAQNTVTLTVPGDGQIIVEALIMASCQYLSGGGSTLKIYSGFAQSAPALGLYAATTSNSNSAWTQVTTNGNSQILTAFTYGGAGTAYSIETLGYIDPRGRNGDA